METEEMSPQEKIRTWFNDPKTPEDAWKEWTIDQLATAANVSSSSILKYLADIVKSKHPEIENYVVFRKVRLDFARKKYKKGERLPEEDIQKIKELRKTHTIHETVALTGFSPATIQRYTAKNKE